MSGRKFSFVEAQMVGGPFIDLPLNPLAPKRACYRLLGSVRSTAVGRDWTPAGFDEWAAPNYVWSALVTPEALAERLFADGRDEANDKNRAN